MIRPYANEHTKTYGPGDARPTALKVVRDEHLDGSLKGKVILITGCSTGIGKETARALNVTGADLVLCGRDIEKLTVVIQELRAEASLGSIRAVYMDLSRMESVRAAAQEVLEQHNRLDVLVCNAGATLLPESKTMDGFESHFAINYLSHFLLFQILKPLMLSTSSLTGCARVVLVSSAGHRYSPILFDSAFELEVYDSNVAYGQSKTALIYMAQEIESRYGAQGLHGFAVHPGGVKNSLYERLDSQVVKYMMAKYWTRMKNPAQGAATSVWAAVSSEAIKLGGRYLEDCGETTSVADSFDDLSPGCAVWVANKEASEQLWVKSLALFASPVEI